MSAFYAALSWQSGVAPRASVDGEQELSAKIVVRSAVSGGSFLSVVPFVVLIREPLPSVLNKIALAVLSTGLVIGG